MMRASSAFDFFAVVCFWYQSAKSSKVSTSFHQQMNALPWHARDHRQRHTRRDTIRFRKEEHTLQIKTLDTAELHRLARLGAIIRLHELAQEATALRKMFPNLKNATETVAEPAPSATKPPKLKRRVVTEAARKSQSEKMKAYWAKKKGEGAAPQPVAEVAEQVQAAKATPKKVARKTRKPKAAKRAKKQA